MKPSNSLLSLAFLIYLFIGKNFTANAQTITGGINFFEGTLKEAIVKAKAENKCIFLDAYASWCVPCKTMDKEVYTDSTIGKYFNSKFISVRIEMEKGDGPRLSKILTSIDGYPSLLFFGRDGNLTKTILGSRTADIFLKEAELVAN